MAPHSSTLAWKIPWMEEPGRLQSTGSLGGLMGVAGRLSGTVSPFRAEQGTSLETPSRARAGRGLGPRDALKKDSRGLCLSLPLGLALGSPIFPSGCEGKLGVALESLQGPEFTNALFPLLPTKALFANSAQRSRIPGRGRTGEMELMGGMWEAGNYTC